MRSGLAVLLLFTIQLLAPIVVVAFSSSLGIGSFHLRSHASKLSVSISSESITSDWERDHRSESFLIPREQIRPVLRFGQGDNEKIVNAFGLYCALVAIVTCTIWAAAMGLVDLVSKVNEDWDPDRSVFDYTGKVWSRTYLTLTNSFPTRSGEVEWLKTYRGPCLFVANHASWLDIPVLCTVLDPVFKFIAKGELKKVPCIGHQLVGGKHILIDREDRRSQLRTFKEGMEWLKKGMPIMAFPEGMRSKDGRLREFKGGLFAMAVKLKVPIVPISISHTHAVMPSYSLFPVQSGANKLHIHIHKPIDSYGQSESHLEELVRACFLSNLPLDHHPLPKLSHNLSSLDCEHVGSVSSVLDHHAVTGLRLAMLSDHVEVKGANQHQTSKQVLHSSALHRQQESSALMLSHDQSVEKILH